MANKKLPAHLVPNNVLLRDVRTHILYFTMQTIFGVTVNYRKRSEQRGRPFASPISLNEETCLKITILHGSVTRLS